MGNNYANQIYGFFAIIDISNPLARPLFITQNQSQEHNDTQQATKPLSHSVKFHDKRKTQTNRTESYPFFQQN